MTLVLPRRKFLFGLAGAFAAPAVIKASSLMRVASIAPVSHRFIFRTSLPITSWRRLSEESRFLEGMSQTIAQTLIYGDSAVDPHQFRGFSTL